MFSFDAVLGSVAGGAIGDAIGGINERGGLSLSDDTQLTLATCEAIVDTGVADPATIANALLRWFRERQISGIGSATLKALRDLEAGAHWALAGARGEMAAGNGAAMRAAPLAFVLDPARPEHRRVIRDICRITHHSEEAYVGALAVLVAIHLDPDPPSEQSALATVASSLPDTRVRDRLLAVAKLPADATIAEVASRFGSSGYVVDTVPLALLIARRMAGPGFATVLHEVAQLPGDMDTICAIAGQVAGAHLGLSRLPADLLALEPVGQALTLARPFANAVGVPPNSPWQK